MDQLEKAFRLSGNDPVVGEHLADAYVKTGQTTEAIRTYRDCQARTEDDTQRQRVAEKIVQLESRARTEPPGI